MSIIDLQKRDAVNQLLAAHHRDALRYEWESAKYKPHARVLSRRPLPPLGFGSDAIQNVYGLSRFGKLTSPNAVIIGRPKDFMEDDGPFGYSLPDEIGRYKPKALIVSRPKLYSKYEKAGKLVNIFGWTRFGKANPPRPVILSRNLPKDKQVPGPGNYDPKDFPNTRIPISITGRPADPYIDVFEPGPNAYLLPNLSKGPAYSMISRHFFADKDQSPGPIYDVRERKDKKKGLSLTFKPFPMHEEEVLPGPSDLGTLPGEQCIKQMKLRPPCVKFGKEFTPDCEPTPTKETPGPGPGAFNLAEFYGTSKDKPHALILSRPKAKAETCGSGKFVNLFGKTRFGAKQQKKAILIGRHFRKEKFEPGPGAYDPHKIPDKRVGITIKSRLPDHSLKYRMGIPGPGQYNLPSFIGKGPAYSIVKKYFHDLEGFEKVPSREQDLLPCLKDELHPELSTGSQSQGAGDWKQQGIDLVDSCLEFVQDNNKNENWDACCMIPFLEKLALSP